MNKLDEIYDNYHSNNMQYNKEEWAEYKKEEKREVYDLINTTAEKIVTSENEFRKYLDSQSNFEYYSVGNALLVTAQMPEAKQLKDFDSWKNIGVYLKKQPVAVKILEPAENYMREDGSIGTNYKVKNVYDVTQVNSRQRITPMKYDNKILVKAFLNSSLSKIKIVDEIPECDKGAFYDSIENLLYVARGASAPKIFHELTQELAKQQIGEETSMENFKKYCVSYMLCKKYNIDVSDYDVKIPQELQGMGAKEIREELEIVRNAMENINSRVTTVIREFIQNKKNLQER